MKTGYLVVLGVALMGIGCRSDQLAHDQDMMRKAILNLETDQVMDNLIRLDKGLPILHIDYTQLTGQITQSVGDEGDLNDTVQHTSVVPVVATAAIARITKQLTNMWTGKVTSSQQNQLSVTGQPVTNSPQLYAAYLNFYNKPGRLMKGDAPPPCDEAIIVRCSDACCDDHGCCESKGSLWKHKKRVFYWVPCAYKDDFRELSIYTVALRGEVQPGPEYYELTVAGIAAEPTIIEDVCTMTIILSKQVPNDNGWLTAVIKGRLYELGELVLQPNPAKDPAVPRKAGQTRKIVNTDRLVLSFKIGAGKNEVNATAGDAVKDLVNQVVKVRLDNFTPGVQKPDNSLQTIVNQLELIRLGQRLSPAP